MPARIALIESDVKRARLQLQTRHSIIIEISKQHAAIMLDSQTRNVGDLVILGGGCEILFGELAHETQRTRCAHTQRWKRN